MSTPPDASVSGVVLAGGRSSRFGRDKLSSEYHGRPLLHHAVLRLLEVCDEVIVVIAPDGEEPAMPGGASVRSVRDETADEGPLRGLEAGLAAASGRWVVVAGGDMPDLQGSVLLEMLRAGRETHAVAVALSDGGDARPLPITLDLEPALRAVEDLLRSDRRSLRDLLASVTTVVMDEPTWVALDPERRTLFDVDEASDLDR